MVSPPGAAFQLPLSLPTPLSGNPPCLHPVQGCVGARMSSEAGSLGLAHSSSLVLCCMNERETVMAGDTVSTFPRKLVWSGRGQGQPGADPGPTRDLCSSGYGLCHFASLGLSFSLCSKAVGSP